MSRRHLLRLWRLLRGGSLEIRLLRETALVLVWLVVIWLNPFGLEGATDERSRDVYMRMAAPYYGDAGRDHISLVLIDDKNH